MSRRTCRRTGALAAAQVSAGLTVADRRHLARCADCARALSLLDPSAVLDAPADILAPLPSAGLVYWKARHLERQATVERALAPIRYVERLACWSAIVAVLVGLAAVTPDVLPWLAGSAAQLPTWAVALGTTTMASIVAGSAVLAAGHATRHV